ncbi:hypothetical protein B0A49_04837 [Cryomyces minteri]|uniref:Uncharacterized protein n=1 Tax=Cryomyces minteri TaxID=331657 RepID=A0A4U0WPB8_9PEZI|nr:hypothetical protein B0A49_04837 [Cryomyces minteri]
MTDVTNITADMTADLTAWEQIVAIFLEMSIVSRFTTFFALATVLGLFIFLIAHGTGSNPWLGLPNHYYDETTPDDVEKDDTYSDDAEKVVVQKYLHLVSAVGERFVTLTSKVQDFVDESTRVNAGLLDSVRLHLTESQAIRQQLETELGELKVELAKTKEQLANTTSELAKTDIELAKLQVDIQNTAVLSSASTVAPKPASLRVPVASISAPTAEAPVSVGATTAAGSRPVSVIAAAAALKKPPVTSFSLPPASAEQEEDSEEEEEEEEGEEEEEQEGEEVEGEESDDDEDPLGDLDRLLDLPPVSDDWDL